jgi:hypothetical protein
MNPIEGTITVTVTARDLARILGATVPFAADPDSGLPAIAAVQLHAGDGLLTATATDRYVLGYARTDATVTPTIRFVMRVEDARSLRKQLSQTMKQREHGAFLVVLSIDEQSERRGMTVDFEPYSFRYMEASTGSAPNLGEVLAANRVDPGTSPSAGPIGIGARTLKPFVKAAQWTDMAPMRWSQGDSMKPITVEMGDWFLGLIMPSRIAEDAKPVSLAMPKVSPAMTSEAAIR